MRLHRVRREATLIVGTTRAVRYQEFIRRSMLIIRKEAPSLSPTFQGFPKS